MVYIDEKAIDGYNYSEHSVFILMFGFWVTSIKEVNYI